MKRILKFAAYTLITVIVLFISCKKEYSCKGSDEKNKPPIAIAGSDQSITLPTDSVSLDGSNSSDQDGIISEWLWTKISGPAFFKYEYTSIIAVNSSIYIVGGWPTNGGSIRSG